MDLSVPGEDRPQPFEQLFCVWEVLNGGGENNIIEMKGRKGWMQDIRVREMQISLFEDANGLPEFGFIQVDTQHFTVVN